MFPLPDATHEQSQSQLCPTLQEAVLNISLSTLSLFALSLAHVAPATVVFHLCSSGSFWHGLGAYPLLPPEMFWNILDPSTMF